MHVYDTYYSQLIRGQTQHPNPTFAKCLPENQNMLALYQTACLSGSISGVGSDTTVSAISVGGLAAACFSKEATIVREDLESVVGAGRAPTLADRDVLLRTCVCDEDV